MFQTHKLYGDYPLFGVDLHLPADLEGDPKAGKPVFRFRPRSEIIEHVSLEQFLRSISLFIYFFLF